jgi:D-threonate/D-erythronate kinase
MLIVIADDFSGAAEMAGIAHRYGLNAKLQLDFSGIDDADVVVIDADTRSMQESNAVKQLESIAGTLKKITKPIRLFKKIDSAMRGHLSVELKTLQNQLNYKRVFLLPANPGKDRKIIRGKYFVQGIELKKTVFARDPGFPITSSIVTEIVNASKDLLQHSHISTKDIIPVSGIITGNIETTADLKNYIQRSEANDLVCGAAECFEAYLEHLGYNACHKKLVTEESKQLPFTLIINGSTVKNTAENDLIKKLSIPYVPLPGNWKQNEFVLEKNEENNWHKEVLDLLRHHHVAMVSIDHPIKEVKGASEIFTGYFGTLIKYISAGIDLANVHFCITGGATASAIIRSIKITRFNVEEEVAQGVVTLRSENGSGFFTVKPGSYPWTESFLERLSTYNNKN